MAQKITTPKQFQIGITILTQELIVGILPSEKMAHHTAEFLLLANDLITKGESEILNALSLFISRYKQFLPTQKKFTSTLDRVLSENGKNGTMENLLSSFILKKDHIEISASPAEKQVKIINENKIPLAKLNRAFPEILQLLENGEEPLAFLDLTGYILKEGELEILLEKCPLLQTLICDGIKISNQALDLIFQKKTLKFLALRACFLSLLTHDFSKLEKLETLNLSKNWLASLHLSLGKLVQLQELRVDENQLLHIPKQIGTLKNLKTLVANNNKLRDLPEELGDLSNLETLELGKNEVFEIPSKMGQMRSLKKLFLKNNWIKKLPSTFKELQALEELDLSHNSLSFFPEVLLELKNLKKLNLRDNDIPGIPIDQLKGVEVLE